ncbi:MAG TPA: BREX system P-loop protein BrxC [Ktedonobacteraceae bacterium]|nr:BREX system P-loop protein BrxC [Ktedonobacteraceae bacterium]
MYIRETFATKIEQRIEPVVKVSNRHPMVVFDELTHLVVTPQWEKYLHRMLEEYTDAFDAEDEREIGIWISGFFGSGKSLLMKVLGMLLEGGEVQGQSIHELFLARLPANSQERKDIARFLTICQNRISTSLVGGNLHAIMATGNDPLALIAFKFFAIERGYTQNWAFAWTIEYQIDMRGRTEQFRKRVEELCGVAWRKVVRDMDIYGEDLYQAAAEVLPEHFSGPDAVQQAITQTFHTGIEPRTLIDRLVRWCENQDRGGRRHKLLLQLDELGQWLQSGDNATRRAMEIQALVETASSFGEGRIWIAVTAHGDVQALKENVQQEVYAKINQRFDIQCKISNEDIDKVVRERLLRKTQEAGSFLRERFKERKGEITDLGSLQQTRRVYRVPTEENFADFYPYLPWMIDVIPNIVKGIAQASNRSEALTGSNRTMIGVVQGGIIETPGFLNRPVGNLLSLADLYDQLAGDAPVETKTDIQRILGSVESATEYTTRVARALYLLGQDEHIPSTLHNITLALINTLETDVSSERPKVKAELERLVIAGYVKQVGETFVFLSTQQRSFQEKVRRREQELYNKNYDLSLKLKDYQSDDALRFGQVPVPNQPGREKLLRIELDGRVIHHPSEQVSVRAFSPMQYYLDQELANDAAMRLKSNQNPNTFFFRMGDVKALRTALARAVATEEVANEVLSSGAGNDHEKRVAQQAREKDLPAHQSDVRYALARAVHEGKVFLNGTSYDLMDGSNPQQEVRNTLSYLLFSTVYTLFQQVPHRITNEATAVKAALNDNNTNSDLQALKVYNADGTLNESSMLISTIKGLLPSAEGDRGTIGADELRQKLEQPPYGWDGNAARVGLALLLRASQCRLLENSSFLTDPHSQEVLDALTKASRFKALRVQGVRSDLKNSELLEARGRVQAVFGEKLPVVATTFNSRLGDLLKGLQEQAQALKAWAATASCPLPAFFSEGHDRVAELLNTSAPSLRIPAFMSEWEAVERYKQLLQDLASFKNEHGTLYIQVRDFFNRMVNAEAVPDAVTTFIRDWRTLSREQTITNAGRWSDLLTAYHTARQALADQIEHSLNETRQGLTELLTNLGAQMTKAGVPAEQLDSELARQVQATGIQQLQADLAQGTTSYGEARRMRNELAKLRINMPVVIREVARRYLPPAPEPGQEPAPSLEVHMNWHVLGETIRIASSTELEQTLERLRRCVTTELAEGRIVILE